jgi:small-conductance mechanosensitive channel
LARASITLLLITACASAGISVGGPGSAPASATPATSRTAQATTLYDIVTDLARVDVLQRETEDLLRNTVDWRSLTTSLDEPALPPPIQALADRSDAVTRVRYMELRILDVHLRERLREISEIATSTGNLTQKLVSQLDRIDREMSVWPGRASAARDAQAPLEVERSVAAVVPALSELREHVVARRDAVLVAYERAVRTQARLEGMRAELLQRRERLWSELRHNLAEPVWRQRNASFPLAEVAANLALLRMDLEWVSHHAAELALTFLAIFAAAFVPLRRHLLMASDASSAPGGLRLALCAAILIAVAASAGLAPSGAPVAFYRVAWLVTPLFAAMIAARSFARSIAATTWAAAFAVCLNEFRVVAEMSALSDWLLLVLQIVPFGIAVTHDWRRGGLAHAFPHSSVHVLRRLVQVDVALLLFGLLLSCAGYTGLASVLVMVGVIMPGYAVSSAALAWSLSRAFIGLLSLPLSQTLLSIRQHRATMLRTFRRLFNAVAWGGGIASLALSYTALDDLQRVAATVANTSVTAGDVTISVRALGFALAVIAMTWIATNVVRFVLDHEVLPRLGLREGVPIAISTIAGYVLIVIGVVLAMGALGMDFSKVTLVAGALGIGVGLGLQNVVNNFASGLILMIERPINVGDQIDVGGVVGEVKRIGVRSSTVCTFQGAEIIVPNADLATKQVTNWTLSDRARRYDIDVAVAHGADPTQVLKLLERAAATVPEVQKRPAPVAAFVGFGENGLDFRLYAWVESVDLGLQAQNGLRTAILAALTAAGIQIPSTGHDVRVRCPLAPTTHPRKSYPGKASLEYRTTSVSST